MNDVLKLAGTKEWMGTHIKKDMRKTRAELVVIIGKLFEEKTLEKGEEYEYIPIDPIENVESRHHSTLKKGDVPSAVATLVGNIKKFALEDLKHVLSTVTHEMEERRIPMGSLSKPLDLSSAHSHDESSVSHGLIKQGALRNNVPKLFSF